MGLAFDEQDLDYYTQLFKDDMKRDPTNVELFDMAQSNSEHSRHWFFGGNIVIDGQKMPKTLMQVRRREGCWGAREWLHIKSRALNKCCPGCEDTRPPGGFLPPTQMLPHGRS
jgi:phosphoribosylformylglycinamidine (FGAM) synthase-like enzyme